MQRSNNATLNDVAKRAGVSKSAVAAVISGYRVGTRVSDTTRAKIQQAARDLGYQPNAIARSLSKRRTNIVGIYNAFGKIDASGAFGALVIGGLQQGCDDYRQDLLVHGTFPGRTTDEIYSELASGKIDGLVVIAPPAHPLVQRLASSQFPVVAVVEPIPNLPSVVADDAGGSAMLVQHLKEKGHRRILYRRTFSDTVSTDRRLVGFLEAAAAAEMDVTVCRPKGPYEHLSDEELALLALPADERPTAVACWSDWFARAIVQYARNRGLRMPDDIALTGFDGFPSYYEPAVHLTTIRAPWPAVAYTALSLIMRRLEGEDIPMETVIPTEFVAGDTT